jgi:hypothetical protein
MQKKEKKSKMKKTRSVWGALGHTRPIDLDNKSKWPLMDNISGRLHHR